MYCRFRLRKVWIFHQIKVKYVKSHSFEMQVESIKPLFYLLSCIILIINE